MFSPLSQDQLDIYEKFYGLAEDFVVRFDTGKAGLVEREYSDTDQIFDGVDDVYAEAKEGIGMDYTEIQVLAALAVINGAEFKAADGMSPGDRSFNGQS